MKVVVLANDLLKEELLAQGVSEEVHIEWINEVSQFAAYDKADAWIDLLFDAQQERIAILQKLLPRPVIINSVCSTLRDMPGEFIRINGWPTFLRRPLLETATTDEARKTEAEKIFRAFHKTTSWVPDVPGFVAARVVAMIINEAYFALAEQVSTKTEIDTAMKLGTNYPFGPFEWSERIGLQNIGKLLELLGKHQPRYAPAVLLQKEMTH